MNQVEKFILGSGTHKYTAILKNGKRVHFGHRGYQQYKDSVPISKGGGKWSNKNHNDTIRRANYRSRHAGILTKQGIPAYKIKYSPSWFSYYYLW